MADLIDFALDAPANGATGDLAFGSDLDLSLVSREDLVKQSLQIKLSTFQGEWFLDLAAGVPYFQSILGGEKVQDLGTVDSLIKAAILEVAEVNRILVYESALVEAPRRLEVSFKVDTTYGPVEVEGVSI